MRYYIGIDLGTSAMKLLMGADGTIHNTVTKEYLLEFPQPGSGRQEYLESIVNNVLFCG